MIALIVLIHDLLHEESLAFELLIEVGYENVFNMGWQFILRSYCVGLKSHLVFFEQVVRDMVVGVVLEVCIELVIGLEIYLSVLQHSQRLFEPVGDLLADQVQVIGHEV
jgi:hypothetical protein